MVVASALGKRTRYALATIGGAFCLAWGEPGAASVTFEYAGTVAAVAALDPVSGNFTFYPAAPDSVPADPTTGVYTLSGGTCGEAPCP